MMPMDNFQVYVGHLHPDVSDKQLYDYFTDCSPHVTNARVIRDSVGRSRGYGFVQFVEDEHAYKAVTALTSRVRPIKPLCGATPFVRETYQRTRAEIDRGVDHINGRTIFVGNINITVGEEALRREFSKFGVIRTVRIVPNKGFGFVSFMEHVAALAALSEMQNVELFHQRVYCSWGRQRDEPEPLDTDPSLRIREEDIADSGLDLFPILQPSTQRQDQNRALSEQDRIALLQQAARSLPILEAETEQAAPVESLKEKNARLIVAGMRKRLKL
jgi:RNA recognition motif-containing protein